MPNVILDNIEAGTPQGGAFSIRGVSYQDVEKTFDPTVLVMVDGVRCRLRCFPSLVRIEMRRWQLLLSRAGNGAYRW